MTPPRIFTSVDALRGAHGDGSFSTPRQTADLVASVEHHMARADAADARIEMAETREERATLERDAAQRALANVVVERDAISADLHRVTMERDGARLSLDAAHEARVKQSLELAEARAQIVRLHVEAGVVDGLRMALDDARGAAAAWELVARDNADRADRLQERIAELEGGR